MGTFILFYMYCIYCTYQHCIYQQLVQKLNCWSHFSKPKVQKLNIKVLNVSFLVNILPKCTL